MLSSLRKKRYYNYLVWIFSFLLIALFFFWGSSIVMKPQWLAADDYLGYWAAARITVQGHNPYSPEWIQSLQSQTELSNELVEVLDNSPWLLPTWSPPSTFPLLMPLAVLNYEFSRVAWFLVNIFVTIFCAETLWRLYSGALKMRWVSWLLAFSFIPVLDAVKKGQIGILILLGIVGFLYFQDKKRPWLAGIALALLVIKPHVAYLFLLSVFIWSFYNRKWSVILGFTLTILGMTIISSLFSPTIVSDYLYAIINYPPSDWLTPTIGGFLRLLFGGEHFWLQFISLLFGIGWLMFYWIKYRKNWDWLSQTPLIVLVSLLTAAYGWSFDQPAALVAIIQIFVLVSVFPSKKASSLIFATYIMINVLNIISPGNEIFLVWLAPVLLLWYLASKWTIEHRISNNETKHQY